MTQEEFSNTNWHRGNVVRLSNGKEYLCKGTKSHGRFLLLYSAEYDKSFIIDYRIVDCRTSDYEEPEEVYLQHKAEHRAKAEAAREAERQERLRQKEALKQQHLKEQEEAHARKLARKLANQQKQAAKTLSAKTLSAKTITKTTAEPVAKTRQSPVAAVAETKAAPAAPSTETPKKRVRQRVRIVKKVDF